MPKTKDAFALRDFDAQRILQRPWFKDLVLVRGKDEDVLCFPNGPLKIISPNEEGYLKGMIERLDTMTRLIERVNEYEQFIYRHMNRLDKMRNVFIKKVMSTEDTTWSDFFVKILSDKTYKEKFIRMVSTKENTVYKEKISRISKLISKYSEFDDVVITLRDRAFSREENVTNLFEKDSRRIFAARLRQARTAAGYTQTQLAKKIGITQGGYTAYETTRREPPLAMISRLARILNRPTDWLLGMTP